MLPGVSSQTPEIPTAPLREPGVAREVSNSSFASSTVSHLASLQQRFGVLPSAYGCLPSLSWQRRLVGAQIGLLVGLLLSVVGAFCGAGPGVVAFETLYVLGSVTAWCATFLLVGPGKQLQLISRSRTRMIVVPCYAAAVTVTVVCVAMLGPAMPTGGLVALSLFAWAMLFANVISFAPHMHITRTFGLRPARGLRGLTPMRRDRGARLESANLTRMEEEMSPPEPGGVSPA